MSDKPATEPRSETFIIPKTHSDMIRAGEEVNQNSATGNQGSGRRFKSLKLSRFNEFSEHVAQVPEREVSENVWSDDGRNDEDISVTAQTTPTEPSYTEDFDKPHSTENEEPTPSLQDSVTLQPIVVDETSAEEEEEENIIFAVCVVGFHHIRGPEVEFWKGCDGDQSKLWQNLPFQALPDGSHSHEENFCYFTLLYDKVKKTAPLAVPIRDRHGNITEDVTDMENVTTLFGISCNRQIRASELKEKPADVTRSTVQKSVIVIARKPIFGPIKEKLALITRAFFLQSNITDMTIIDNLYDNLRLLFSNKLEENDLYVGMSLRELLYRLRSKVLVLLKALLLETKIIFFANDTESICASQFSIVSLIPGLMENLGDCGSPCLKQKELKKPTSLKSSDRKSLLAYMGLPLHPFGEGGLFDPYVPLQQFNELKAPETKFFLVGTTNSLMLSSQNKVADIVVHMDENNVEIVNSSLSSVLALSPSDKRWIESVVNSVVDTWDSEDPWQSKGLGFVGSEDFVRQQFEDYIMALMSSIKYDQFLRNSPPKAMQLRNVTDNPIKLYNDKWVQDWRRTNNFRIFSKITDDEIFDIVEPRHMASTIATFGETIQRRVSELEVPAAKVAKAWGDFWWGGQQEEDNDSESVKTRSRAGTGSSVNSQPPVQVLTKNLFSSWWGGNSST